jgi:hypothetical protein
LSSRLIVGVNAPDDEGSDGENDQYNDNEPETAGTATARLRGVLGQKVARVGNSFFRCCT